MIQFWEEHKKKIIGVIAIAIVAVALFAGGKNLNASALESVLGFVVTPFQDLTTGIENWVDSTAASAKDKTALTEENAQLKADLAKLQDENKRLEQYAKENAALSSLLKISQKYPEYKSTGTKIIAKNPGVWYNTFTINKGTDDTVSANMILIAPGGVVGKILESGKTYSKAQSILDSRSAVPAMSVRTGDLGVVKGDYTLMNDGLCKMEYIDGEAQIAVGDEIVTSQLSDVYPAGLSIGKVTKIETDTNGLTKYAIIEPFVDLKHLDTLLVIDKNTLEEAP
ncbi:cell shape-determining protein MreC precursor [Anaerotignum neopropionicum]|uniref:Cell shape-determining protein MreC n=1 Tax=Anaerotignum neopropionicum TaxID=36847 RepID=A0A136WI68_9FIRM|nr:rod shape-determining protein MreC [Anaerotignum neopropionicum]KXL54049.1 cell shape-determining protein MreC precursor [Anaerotignum neopropionicum]